RPQPDPTPRLVERPPHRPDQNHPPRPPRTRPDSLTELTIRVGVPRKRAEESARELLARLGLADKAHEHPDRLSGGQQQRAAIARALATEPELLLFDEITSALDPELVGEVLDVVADLKQRGLTILMATHEMGFARQVADQVCFLEDGVIVEQGTAEQVLTAPREQATQRFLTRVLDRAQ
ncbi:amino acid ABC transporter ATP-binding protein, partial [Streptomyces sp. H27-H5]|uniref:amino acid ABC transporter ATP-binding protein n=1 Tax=Streptomyces sp. H27-H5 TaxID=2996460 RepID=UPI00226EA156